MTRLTDPLCKGVRNPHKTLKKYVQNNFITNQNRKIRQPNVLGNRVLETTPRISESACKDEMLVMMACWKKHDFKEGTCSDEYNNFSRCMTKTREKVLTAKKFADSGELGQVSADGQMNPKQINKLLSMYKQPPYSIQLTHGAGKPQRKVLQFDQVTDNRTIPENLWGLPTKQNKR